MSPSSADLELLQSYVDQSEYATAIALCEERLEQLPGDAGWQYYLGLLLFLNDVDIRWYECIEPLAQAAEKLPDELTVQFWFAYALLILVPDEAAERRAEKILRDILAVKPNHPYANIVLAGGVAGEDESILALTRALTVQPNNRRALSEVCKLLVRKDRASEARPLLERAIGYKPYVETRYGLMNSYVNEALCAANSRFVADEAWKLLGEIGEN